MNTNYPDTQLERFSNLFAPGMVLEGKFWEGLHPLQGIALRNNLIRDGEDVIVDGEVNLDRDMRLVVDHWHIYPPGRGRLLLRGEDAFGTSDINAEVNYQDGKFVIDMTRFKYASTIADAPRHPLFLDLQLFRGEVMRVDGRSTMNGSHMVSKHLFVPYFASWHVTEVEGANRLL